MLLWNLLEKFILSLFIESIDSGGGWPKVFDKVFIMVFLKLIKKNISALQDNMHHTWYEPCIEKHVN